VLLTAATVAPWRTVLRHSKPPWQVRIIELQVPNDLVVPEPVVYEANGCATFPIPDTCVLKVPSDAGIIHTTMFSYAPVSEKLTEWLA
jgi:hypothetical protein